VLSPHYNAHHNALELAAALEQKSSHPLANAIVSAHCGCIAEMEGDLPAAKKIKVSSIQFVGMVFTNDTSRPLTELVSRV
jgi:cation transport ATPase